MFTPPGARLPRQIGQHRPKLRLGISVRGQHQQRCRTEIPGDMPQQQQRSWVRPVHVVENHQQAPLGVLLRCLIGGRADPWFLPRSDRLGEFGERRGDP
jgi:hypothetical protein